MVVNNQNDAAIVTYCQANNILAAYTQASAPHWIFNSNANTAADWKQTILKGVYGFHTNNNSFGANTLLTSASGADDNVPLNIVWTIKVGTNQLVTGSTANSQSVFDNALPLYNVYTKTITASLYDGIIRISEMLGSFPKNQVLAIKISNNQDNGNSRIVTFLPNRMNAAINTTSYSSVTKGKIVNSYLTATYVDADGNTASLAPGIKSLLMLKDDANTPNSSACAKPDGSVDGPNEALLATGGNGRQLYLEAEDYENNFLAVLANTTCTELTINSVTENRLVFSTDGTAANGLGVLINESDFSTYTKTANTTNASLGVYDSSIQYANMSSVSVTGEFYVSNAQGAYTSIINNASTVGQSVVHSTGDVYYTLKMASIANTQITLTATSASGGVGNNSTPEFALQSADNTKAIFKLVATELDVTDTGKTHALTAQVTNNGSAATYTLKVHVTPGGNTTLISALHNSQNGSFNALSIVDANAGGTAIPGGSTDFEVSHVAYAVNDTYDHNYSNNNITAPRINMNRWFSAKNTTVGATSVTEFKTGVSGGANITMENGYQSGLTSTNMNTALFDNVADTYDGQASNTAWANHSASRSYEVKLLDTNAATLKTETNANFETAWTALHNDTTHSPLLASSTGTSIVVTYTVTHSFSNLDANYPGGDFSDADSLAYTIDLNRQDSYVTAAQTTGAYDFTDNQITNVAHLSIERFALALDGSNMATTNAAGAAIVITDASATTFTSPANNTVIYTVPHTVTKTMAQVYTAFNNVGANLNNMVQVINTAAFGDRLAKKLTTHSLTGFATHDNAGNNAVTAANLWSNGNFLATSVTAESNGTALTATSWASTSDLAFNGSPVEYTVSTTVTDGVTHGDALHALMSAQSFTMSSAAVNKTSGSHAVAVSGTVGDQATAITKVRMAKSVDWDLESVNAGGDGTANALHTALATHPLASGTNSTAAGVSQLLVGAHTANADISPLWARSAYSFVTAQTIYAAVNNAVVQAGYWAGSANNKAPTVYNSALAALTIGNGLNGDTVTTASVVINNELFHYPTGKTSGNGSPYITASVNGAIAFTNKASGIAAFGARLSGLITNTAANTLIGNPAAKDVVANANWDFEGSTNGNLLVAKISTEDIHPVAILTHNTKNVITNASRANANSATSTFTFASTEMKYHSNNDTDTTVGLVNKIWASDANHSYLVYDNSVGSPSPATGYLRKVGASFGLYTHATNNTAWDVTGLPVDGVTTYSSKISGTPAAYLQTAAGAELTFTAPFFYTFLVTPQVTENQASVSGAQEYLRVLDREHTVNGSTFNDDLDLAQRLWVAADFPVDTGGAGATGVAVQQATYTTNLPNNFTFSWN